MQLVISRSMSELSLGPLGIFDDALFGLTRDLNQGLLDHTKRRVFNLGNISQTGYSTQIFIK